MIVPFTALDRRYKQYKKEYLDILDHVLITGRPGDENTAKFFEEALKAIQWRKFAVACNGNADALLLAIKALDLPKNSDIIIPAFGPIAPASAILLAGHKPLFVDVHADGSINLDDIPHRLTDNTKAMIVLDMFSFTVDRDSVQKTAEVYNIPVIHECSQSLGAKWADKPSGSTGIMSCLSFSPVNGLPSFTGGSAVLCDEELMNFFLRGLREDGKGMKQPGHNTMMSAPASALLTYDINHMLFRMLKRQDIYIHYNEHLEGLHDIFPVALLFPSLRPPLIDARTNYSEYIILAEKRDKLKTFLEQKEIETKIPYDFILPNQPMFGKQPNDFFVAEQLIKECLSLPIFSEMTIWEWETVIDEVIKFSENH